MLPYRLFTTACDPGCRGCEARLLPSSGPLKDPVSYTHVYSRLSKSLDFPASLPVHYSLPQASVSWGWFGGGVGRRSTGDQPLNTPA